MNHNDPRLNMLPIGGDPIKKKTILEEAEEITTGNRRRAYGHPSLNHGNTAEFWSSYIKRKYGTSVPLTSRDVCFMMVMLKISRDCNKEDRENLTDIVGYARNAEMIEDAKGKEAPDKR